MPSPTATITPEDLSRILDRLDGGEALETVRADFAADFAAVPAQTIAQAEQALLDSGTPVAEVQRLCDVHAALFTEADHCSALDLDLSSMEAAAAQAVQACGTTGAGEKPIDPENPLVGLPQGHPLALLDRENEKILALVASIREVTSDVADGSADDGGAPDGDVADGGADDGGAPDGGVPDGDVADGSADDGGMADGGAADGGAPDGGAADGDSAAGDASTAIAETSRRRAVVQGLQALKDLKSHYRKKEELLMPLLADHGFPGPGQVMWGVDDEISAERGHLAKTYGQGSSAALDRRLGSLLDRVTEMVAKERRILFPLALEQLTGDEWFRAYLDLNEFGSAFGVDPVSWPEAEAWGDTHRMEPRAEEGLIETAHGSLTVGQFAAMADLLPVDITFIDAEDHNRFYINNGRFFARPTSTLGRDMHDCHPPRLRPMVDGLLEAFKAGRKDVQEVWIRNPENPVRVRYHAVRDEKGHYLGTLEVVQEFGDAMEVLGSLRS